MKNPKFLFLALAMSCSIASAAPKLEEVGKLEMPGDTALTNTLVFSADGKTLYGSDLSKPIIWVWDIATGKRRELIRFPGGDIWDMDLSPDGKELRVSVENEEGVYTDIVRIELPSGEVTGSILTMSV